MRFESIWDWLFIKFDPLLRPNHGGINVDVIVQEILASMDGAASQRKPSSAFLRHIISRFLCLLFPTSTLCSSGFLDTSRQTFLIRRLSRSESAERESNVPKFPDEARELFAKEIRDEIQGRRSARSLLSLARSPPSASIKRSRTWITPEDPHASPANPNVVRSLSLPPLAAQHSLRDLADVTLERSALEAEPTSNPDSPPSQEIPDAEALFTRMTDTSMSSSQRFARYDRQFEWLYQTCSDAKRARTTMQQEYRQQHLAISTLVQQLAQRVAALESELADLKRNS